MSNTAKRLYPVGYRPRKPAVKRWAWGATIGVAFMAWPTVEWVIEHIIKAESSSAVQAVEIQSLKENQNKNDKAHGDLAAAIKENHDAIADAVEQAMAKALEAEERHSEALNEIRYLIEGIRRK